MWVSEGRKTVEEAVPDPLVEVSAPAVPDSPEPDLDAGGVELMVCRKLTTLPYELGPRGVLTTPEVEVVIVGGPGPERE